MYKNYALRVFKSISIYILLFLTSGLLLFETVETNAEDFYIAPNGSDNNIGSSNAPWRSFDKSMEVLRPGDTLFLMDGIFTERLRVTISGTSSNPIIFKALNDGKAIIDMKGSGDLGTEALKIAGTDNKHLAYIEVEGIVCKNANGNVVAIRRADNISIRRVSAYNANPDENYVVFSVAYDCTDILLEDCAASGTGRKMYDVFSDSNATFRRCWGRWVDHKLGTWNSSLDVYGADDCIVENCIFTMDPKVTRRVHGIGIVDQSNSEADRNKIHGNVVYGINSYCYYVSSGGGHHIKDNRHVDNVAIMDNRSIGGRGFLQSADGNWAGDRFTLVGSSDVDLVTITAMASGQDRDFEVRGVFRNSVLFSGDVGIKVTSSPLIGSFTNKYNNLSSITNPYAGIASQGWGEGNIEGVIPDYSTSKYGKGAYLIRPVNLRGKGENGSDIGAEVLYQYIDGTLHRDDQHRLWPWPMEDRIRAETGVSVTWEASGGLWKTLDGVYDGRPTTGTPITGTPTTGTPTTGTPFGVLMSSPEPGSALTTQAVTFEWNAGAEVTGYWLGVGTSFASVSTSPWGDIYAASSGTNTMQQVTGIPTNGNPVYLRLWWRNNGVWDYEDYTYQTVNDGS
ncbi:MAG: hypothetical protein MRK01_16015 [Candidatus Scalindua sp.]|nr:hypothetical protein [Candidatus Scalindua sp.]